MLFRVVQGILKNIDQTSMHELDIFLRKSLNLIIPLHLKDPVNIPIISVSVNGKRRGFITGEIMMNVKSLLLWVSMADEIHFQQIVRFLTDLVPDFIHQDIKGIFLMIFDNPVNVMIDFLHEIHEGKLFLQLDPERNGTDKHPYHLFVHKSRAVMAGTADNDVVNVQGPGDIKGKTGKNESKK